MSRPVRRITGSMALVVALACSGCAKEPPPADPQSAAASPADLPAHVSEALASWAVPVPGVETVSGWPKRIRRLRDGGEMVLIPAGTFWMGRTHPEDRQLNDTPRHEVELTRSYYMDRTEVTVGQWKIFAADRPGVRAMNDADAPDDLPVHGVAHADARAYAAWAGCRLPTEAEWEWAARGGAPAWRYPWGDEDDVTLRNAAGSEDGFENLAPAGSYPPNAYGLHDMSGNVWEWCEDRYRREYYAESPRVDPPGAESSHGKFAVRGGDFLSGPGRLQVSYREGWLGSADYVGFRLVHPLE